MSLLTEQEIRDLSRSVQEIGENSDRALILAAQKAVIEKIKSQGSTAWVWPEMGKGDKAIITINEDDVSGWHGHAKPLYRLPEGDREMRIDPELKPGELYVGRINDQHIILLPGDNDNANWQDALGWAKSIGGDLPNRIEQSMLFAHHKELFEKDWYWSNETCAWNSACAWCQGFHYGGQLHTRKGNPCRARAVRRLVIEK